MITKWPKGSGLVVNESKTEVCLFHRNDNIGDFNFWTKEAVEYQTSVSDSCLTLSTE